MSNKKDKVITIILLIIMFICIYIIDEQEESRINKIETTIENHTHYIDKLEADVDNLYKIIE